MILLARACVCQYDPHVVLIILADFCRIWGCAPLAGIQPLTAHHIPGKEEGEGGGRNKEPIPGTPFRRPRTLNKWRNYMFFYV